LKAVRQVLPVNAQASFDAQVSAITLVQRSPPSWTEIAFYRKRSGRVDWSGIPLFPCTDETRLATIDFVVAGRAYKSTLTATSGHIFDFATTPGPKKVAFETWDSEPQIHLVGDPLAAPRGRRTREFLPQIWQDLLLRLPDSGTIGWELYGSDDAYRITLDSAEYLVLAAREGNEFILHRIEPIAAGLFYLPSHDADPEPLIEEITTILKRNP
jgi:hypothetical protein